MARPLFLALLVLCAALFSPALAFYGKGSDVISIKTRKELDKALKSPHLYMIELYREGCGYCQQLTPEYEKTAQKLRKMVGVAAIDVEKNRDVAQAIMQEFGFEIKGVPTIIALKPKANGGKKEKLDYNGERKAGAMTDFLIKHMPDRIARVSAASHDAWLKKNPSVPKALLFSDKKTPAPLAKALSVKYKDRLDIGMVGKEDKKLMSQYGVTTVPSLLVVKGDGSEPVPFSGKMAMASLDFFLMDHALPKKGGKDDDDDANNAKDAAGKKGKKPAADKKAAEKTPKKEEAKKKPAAEPKSKKADTAKAAPKGSIKIKGADLNKFSVKQLREILKRWDEPCNACSEKWNFVQRAEQLREELGDRDPVSDEL